jgi:glucose/mannose transport system substrate-binding protein
VRAASQIGNDSIVNEIVDNFIDKTRRTRYWAQARRDSAKRKTSEEPMLALRTGAAIAVIALVSAIASAEPRVSVMSQWSAGAEGAALNAFGDLVTKAGAKWENDAVSGFTTDMMNKLRADIIAGHPPAMSQLKGPEIKAWSSISPTVNLNEMVAEAGYEKMISPDLAKLHKVNGNWVALPLQIYRVNTLFASKIAMDKIGATALPKTWDEFNAMAKRFADAGIIPVAHGGLAWADAVQFEIVLAGISPIAYKKAIMELDDAALRGPEVLAALTELRQLTKWMTPSNAGQHWSVFAPNLMKGEYGFLMMGGWASGVLKRGKFEEGKDFLCGPTPSDSGKPVFDMNADGLIFWDTKNPDYAAGQKIAAKVAMGQEFSRVFTQINGSIPVRSDIDLSDPAYQPCQRDASSNLAGAVDAGQVVMSLGNNMALPNGPTAALRDVLTEFVHNDTITPAEAQQRLADAADTVR